MRKVAMAATLLSFVLGSSASAQQVIATDPFTGAITGANAAAAQGAAAAGPLGALVAAPLGLAAGAVAGTLGAVGTVAGAVTGTPVYYQAEPAATRVVNVTPRRAVSRVAYAYPRRTFVQRVASRTTPAYRRVAFRSGPA